MTFSPFFSLYLLFHSDTPFFLQADLIKEGKTANSNGVIPAAQSSSLEDDDEAQADDPSQDGAPGGTLPYKFYLLNFSYKSETLLLHLAFGVRLV